MNSETNTKTSGFSTFLAAFIFVLSGYLTLVAGCATVDTQNKRAAAMEITYQETLKTAILYKREGRLDAAQIGKIEALFKKVDQARAAYYLAAEAGLTGLAGTELEKFNSALSVLRTILLEIEDERKDNTGTRYDVNGTQYSHSDSAAYCCGRD